MGLIAGLALFNDLGSHHWFQPYDRVVYGIALLAAAVWYAFFGNEMRAWLAAEQVKLGEEDSVE